MKIRKYFSLFLFAFVLIAISSCRKKIDVPNDKCGQLFGTWEWISSSGGIVGTEINPSTENYTMRVVYTNKGVYKRYKDGKKTSNANFTFNLGETIYSTEQDYLIKYKQGSLSKKLKVSNSFSFNGPDTLILRYECFDCTSSLFVRR